MKVWEVVNFICVRVRPEERGQFLSHLNLAPSSLLSVSILYKSGSQGSVLNTISSSKDAEINFYDQSLPGPETVTSNTEPNIGDMYSGPPLATVFTENSSF